MTLFAKSSVLTILLILVSAVGAFGTTISDYHKRLDAARTDVSYLRKLDDESQGSSRLRKEKIDDIRRLVSPTEHVEWQGGNVETDNQWLHDQLAAYLEQDDRTAQQTTLIGIDERLSAIVKKIDELENAVAADRSKGEDKQKLAEILSRDEYQKPEVKDDSLFQKWWKAFWDWVAQFFPKEPILPEAPAGLGSVAFLLQILIYAAVIAVIGFLIYRFVPGLVGRFGYKPKEKKRDRVILGERIAADESANDLFSEAERLAREGHLRDAIRKGYIAVLCELSDRKMIGLARSED